MRRASLRVSAVMNSLNSLSQRLLLMVSSRNKKCSFHDMSLTYEYRLEVYNIRPTWKTHFECEEVAGCSI